MKNPCAISFVELENTQLASIVGGGSWSDYGWCVAGQIAWAVPKDAAIGAGGGALVGLAGLFTVPVGAGVGAIGGALGGVVSGGLLGGYMCW